MSPLCHSRPFHVIDELFSLAVAGLQLITQGRVVTAQTMELFSIRMFARFTVSGKSPGKYIQYNLIVLRQDLRQHL